MRLVPSPARRSPPRPTCRRGALAALLLVLAPAAARASGTAAEEGTLLTPHRLARLSQVGQAALSPDGGRVAYTLSVPRDPGVDEDGRSWSELWLVDFADGEPRPFVTGEVGVRSVSWTPDGEGIAFLAKRGDDEHTALYVIPADGGEARRAVALETSISSYSFNGDGTRVALIASAPLAEDREKARKKGFDQEIYEEDWSARRIWVAVPFDEDSEPMALELEGSAFTIAWNPVDDRLAAAIAPTPLVDDSYVAKRIQLLDANDGTTIRTYAREGKLGAIRWSPDGRHLAIISGAHENDPTNARLMVAPAEGGEFARLFEGREGDVDEVRWHDAENLIFLASNGVASELRTVRLDGTDEGLLTGPAGASLRGLTLAADGLSASFLGSTARHPAEVYVMAHGDEGLRRLTESNPELDELTFAKQEIVRWNARDGLELEGILIRPLEEQRGQRYPLLVVVHGGPEAHYDDGWLTRYSSGGQVAAARGFAVFYPNYRGSTGRGLDFAMSSQGDPAGAEFDDVIDGVDHLIASGLVDAERVGVTGGSYGGYATAWLSTAHTDRFAAGVMFVGISDKISKAGTTDIPKEMFLVHDRYMPWDDWQKSLERSPIYHAEGCETPLLILHGKKDTRVDPGQSRELYRHLKLRGQAPVRLVYYPKEGHGNRNAAARLDYNLRLMRWMEHYLTGPGGEAPPWDLDHADPEAEPESEEGEEDAEAVDASFGTGG